MQDLKQVVFIVKGEPGKGLGHCYRALTIAAALGPRVHCQFVITPGSQAALRFLHSRVPQQCQVAGNQSYLMATLAALQPDLIVNDVLNTTADYMAPQAALGVPIINFEDLGAGGLYADRVINAVYSGYPSPRERYGYEYMDIRPSFFAARKPAPQVRPAVRSALLTFGGEDPSNITQAVLNLIAHNPLLAGIHYKVALGPAYLYQAEVADYIHRHGLNAEIFVNTDIAGLMADVDITVIANCRTVFEAAFMRIPAVVISANARECLHTFYRTARYPYCGNVNLVNPAVIEQNLVQLVSDYALRQQIVAGLQALDLEHGLERITAEIHTLLRLDCAV